MITRFSRLVQTKIIRYFFFKKNFHSVNMLHASNSLISLYCKNAELSSMSLSFMAWPVTHNSVSLHTTSSRWPLKAIFARGKSVKSRDRRKLVQLMRICLCADHMLDASGFSREMSRDSSSGIVLPTIEKVQDPKLKWNIIQRQVRAQCGA